MEETSPIRGTFVYVAWRVDLRLRGPFVRASADRQRFIGDGLPAVTGRLRESAAVARVRCLESTFIAPVADHPRFDVMMLVDGGDDVSSFVSAAIEASGVPAPALVCDAVNAVRFGDTDSQTGPILLNHFVSGSPSAQVVETWTKISQWYGSVLGVTNSTLLELTGDAPFAVMNYASIPGPVVRFMLDQLLRPSFYRNVNAPLKAADARALPIFARRVG